MRMSTKTQLNFVNGTSRHPRCLASTSIAGNQWAAWESPTSATVTAPFLSPYTQAGGFDPARDSPHPSARSESVVLSAPAARDGVRSRGKAPSIRGVGRGAA